MSKEAFDYAKWVYVHGLRKSEDIEQTIRLSADLLFFVKFGGIKVELKVKHYISLSTVWKSIST